MSEEYYLSWNECIKVAAGQADLGTKPAFVGWRERHQFSKNLPDLLKQAIALRCSGATSVFIKGLDSLSLDFIEFHRDGIPSLSTALKEAYRVIEHHSFIPIQCRDADTVDFLASSLWDFGFFPTPEIGSLWGTISPFGVLMFSAENFKPVAQNYAGFQFLREINDRSIDFPNHLERVKFEPFASEWKQPWFYTQGLDLSKALTPAYDKAKGVIAIEPLKGARFYSVQITVIADLPSQGFAKPVSVDKRLFGAWQKRARKQGQNLINQERSQ